MLATIIAEMCGLGCIIIFGSGSNRLPSNLVAGERHFLRRPRIEFRVTAGGVEGGSTVVDEARAARDTAKSHLLFCSRSFLNQGDNVILKILVNGCIRSNLIRLGLDCSGNSFSYHDFHLLVPWLALGIRSFIQKFTLATFLWQISVQTLGFTTITVVAQLFALVVGKGRVFGTGVKAQLNTGFASSGLGSCCLAPERKRGQQLQRYWHYVFGCLFAGLQQDHGAARKKQLIQSHSSYHIQLDCCEQGP
jgi:hypothetical protein